MSVIDASSLGLPETFNVATHFVDRNVADGRGAHVAIEYGDARITYDEVLRDVNRTGNALRGLGVRPEERVLLLLFDGPEFVYSFFGAIKIGAVPIPLNTLWKPADYQHAIRDSRAGVLIVHADLLPQIEKIPAFERSSIRRLIVVGAARASADAACIGFGALVAEASPNLEAEPTSRDAPAFWLYSSGSTGAPKGCVHLHHDMVVCAELFGKGVLDIRPNDRCFSVAKLFFAYGLGNALYFPFAVGATTILWPGAPTPQNVYGVIERHKPTLFFSVPTGYGMLLAHQPRRPEGLHYESPRVHDASPRVHDASPRVHDASPGVHDASPRVHDASPRVHDTSPRVHDTSPRVHDTSPRVHDASPRAHDASPRAHDASPRADDASPRADDDSRSADLQVRDFDLSSVRLAVSAGEALPSALYERFKLRFGIDIIDGIGSTETLHMFISNRPDAIRPGSSGLLVRGYEARLLDDGGAPVPAKEIGNLWIKGDSVCAGYWNQHEKTKQTIEGHWIRTGDKYTQDDGGFYWYAGRSDDMLKVGGLWVSPIEVENALVAHPAVLECGVVGREDHDGLVKPMAFVILRAGASATPELAGELQQFVRERLAEYKRPRWVEFLPELPKTATGKIQRFRLRAAAAERAPA